MRQQIAHITLLVKDYDEAISFYIQKLQFVLIEDSIISETKRWVMVAPPGSSSTCLLLARATNPEQISRIGNQTGGRVFLFLYTDDIQRDYERMLNNGVRFVRPITNENYGIVTVFEDIYGNLWDLIQPHKSNLAF